MTKPYTHLISAQNLSANLDGGNWVLIDCRHQLLDHTYGPRVYAEGHVPGARYADMEDVLSGHKTGANGRHPLPDWNGFRDWLGNQGISNDVQVIAYDDANGAFSSRVWFMLRLLGHDAVAVLDGGWAAWQAAGLTVDSTLPDIVPTTFAGEPDAGMLAPLEEVLAMSSGGGHLLVDARGPGRYRGEEEPIDPRAGHIPGAINLPFPANVNEDGTFKSPEVLKARFLQGFGDAAPENTVHYCGSGVTACHNLLALAVAGLPMGRLYPGSWSEWCADDERPAATGDSP